MSAQPLVSIVVPCHNAQRWIGETLRSALAQTWPRIEIVVVDDGSTDDSLDIVKSFGDAVRWSAGPNRGACAARNAGFALASGDYIQFLDADDLLPPDKIERQVEALAGRPRDAIATCGWRHFTSTTQGEPEERAFWRSYEHGVDLLVDMWLDGGFYVPHCWLVPADVVRRAGPWNESLQADQDGEFFGRVLLCAAPVVFVEGPRVGYRTPGTANVSAIRTRAAAESRLRAWESLRTHLAAHRSDPQAKRAAVRRLRAITYSYAAGDSELIAKAARYESQLAVNDLDPGLPPVSRYLIGMLGLKRGLAVRGFLKH